jgi:N-acetylmuramoyl-L-alanine amidase
LNKRHLKNYYFPLISVLAWLVLFLGPLSPPLSAAGELARAQAARASFLQNISGKKRSDWLNLITQFEEAAAAQPKAEPAARARYLAAELAIMSFERFGQEPDVQRARTLARRVIRNCPRCEPAPASQVIIGQALIYGNKPDEAYRELMKVELNFPGSPERLKARTLMASLRPGGTPPPEPERTAADTPPGDKTRDTAPAASPGRDKPPAPPAASKSPAVKEVRIVHPKIPKARNDGRPQVYSLNLVDYGAYQEVVAYIDQVTPYVYNLLPPAGAGGAFRVYADFKGAKLYPQLNDRLNKTTGLIKLVKASQLNNDTVRLVADLAQAYPYRPLFLENPSRLIIQVAKDGADLPRPEPDAPPSLPPPKEPKVKPEANTPVRPVRGPSNSLARQLGLKIRRVVIDPGHGGKDTGASGNGVREKEVVLKAASLLAEKIRKRLGLTVILTRDSDRFITLDRRTRLARENQGDLFISVHANANNLAKVEGFETYILNFTDDRRALETAARENAASDKSMSEMFNILEQIAKNTKVAESRVLAKSLHTGALSRLGKKFKIRDLGVKEAVFIVLANVEVPSVLLEIGFVTNKGEAEKLTKQEYLEAMTDGLVDGLKAYIDGLPK